MALNYTYGKYKDTYTIENTSANELTYSISRRDCEILTPFKEGTIAIAATVELPITKSDGVYVVTISDGVIEAEIADILMYNNTLLAIIDNIETIVCNCKECNDCEDCDDCDLYLSTINTILAFKYLNNPLYNSNTDALMLLLNCNISTELLEFTAQKMITGDIDSKLLSLITIAMEYLNIYAVDFVGAFDEEEELYIDAKFNILRITKCLYKLGFNVKEILAEIKTE